MEKQALTDFIQSSIPDFRFTKDDLQTIVSQFEEVEFSKNEFLLKQGKISNYFFLEEGFVRAFTFDASGNEITTAFYQRGRVIFEAASFFLSSSSVESLQALTECRAFMTNFEKLNLLFHTVPAFREFGRAMLVRELIACKQRSLSAINLSAEERYAQLMAQSSEIFQVAQLKQIASFLGVTDTSLSRIRSQFAKR